jgi:ubiquinone/menaquinone biosynthesis C-methylase UbiE
MGEALKATGQMFHDDTVADFGGNDGYAANEFFKAHAIKPLVVDCEPQRIEHARVVYGLSTYEAFIEDMKDLADKSIDWGFCSHTLEHTRDTAKALREIARVVKRGCLFILPIEDEEHAARNMAHACHADSLKEWKALVLANGWKVTKHGARRPIPQECYIMAVPK